MLYGGHPVIGDGHDLPTLTVPFLRNGVSCSPDPGFAFDEVSRAVHRQSIGGFSTWIAAFGVFVGLAIESLG